MDPASECYGCACLGCGAEADATCFKDTGMVMRWCAVCYRVFRFEPAHCHDEPTEPRGRRGIAE